MPVHPSCYQLNQIIKVVGATRRANNFNKLRYATPGLRALHVLSHLLEKSNEVGSVMFHSEGRLQGCKANRLGTQPDSRLRL